MKNISILSAALIFLINPFKSLATLGVGTSSSNDAIAIMWNSARGIAPASGSNPAVLTVSGSNGQANGVTIPEGTLIYGRYITDTSYFFWDGVKWERMVQDGTIPPNSIDSVHIKSNAIYSNHISNDAINADHLNVTSTVNKTDSVLVVNSDGTFSLGNTSVEFKAGLKKQAASSGIQRDTVRILLSDVDDALTINNDTLKVADSGIKTIKIAGKAVTGPKLAVPSSTTILNSTNESNFFILGIDTTTSGNDTLSAFSVSNLSATAGSNLSVRIAASTYQEALEVCWAMSNTEAQTTGITSATVRTSATDSDNWRLATVKELTELYHQVQADGGVDWNATRSNFGLQTTAATTPANYFTADPSYTHMRDALGYDGYLGTFCFNDGTPNTNYEVGYMQDTSGSGDWISTPFFVSRHGKIMMTNEGLTNPDPFVNPGTYDEDNNGDLVSDGTKYACNRTHFRCVK